MHPRLPCAEYQANVLHHIAGARAQELGLDSYSLGSFRRQVEKEIIGELNGGTDCVKTQ